MDYKSVKSGDKQVKWLENARTEDLSQGVLSGGEAAGLLGAGRYMDPAHLD